MKHYTALAIMEQQSTCKDDPGPQMEVNDVIFIQPQCSQRVVLAGNTINKHPCIHFQESEMEKRMFENIRPLSQFLHSC